MGANLFSVQSGLGTYDISTWLFLPGAGKSLENRIYISTASIVSLKINYPLFNPLMDGVVVFRNTMQQSEMIPAILTNKIVYLGIHMEDHTERTIDKPVIEEVFLVTSIDSVRVDSTTMQYTLSFVSRNWWTFTKNAYFSTNGIETSVFDCIYKSFRSAGGIYVKEYSGRNLPQLMLNYTSTKNDTLYTIYSYLKDKSVTLLKDSNNPVLFTVRYNEIEDVYEFWTLNDAMSNISGKHIDVLYLRSSSSDVIGYLSYVKDFRYSDSDILTQLSNSDTSIFNEFDYSTGMFTKKLYTQEQKIDTLSPISHVNDRANRLIPPFISAKEYVLELTESPAQYDKSTSFPTAGIIKSVYNELVDTFLRRQVNVTTIPSFKRLPGDLLQLSISEAEHNALGVYTSLLSGIQGIYVITNVSYNYKAYGNDSVNGLFQTLSLTKNYNTYINI